MVAAVPGADRLAGHIVQHPALARLHAGLVDAVAEHVVVVAHDDAVFGVDDLALVAFDVQIRRGSRILLGGSALSRSNRLWAMVRKVRPSVSKWATVGVFGVDARPSPRAAVPGSPLGVRAMRCLRTRSAGSRHPAGGGRNRLTSGSVLGSSHQHGVVDVPGFLPPRIEDDLFPGVVGMQRGDDALDRVVEQHRADADAYVELETRGCR